MACSDTTPLDVMNHTFTNFIVGSSNQLAHTAALAIADQTTSAYNPLLICGASGVGKTHLLQAIYHHTHRGNISRRAVYLTAERFTQELLQAVQTDSIEPLRHRYRQADILLMDDVQHLAGKEYTQEVFLHTFDALCNADKFIVLASDTAPQDLAPLAPRLRSRLTSGLIAEIKPLDLATRLAIVENKARDYHIELPPEVAQGIAVGISTNGWELETCLARLVAYASLYTRSIDEAMATTVLQQMHEERGQAITVPHIQRAVAAHFGVTTNDLKSRQRQRAVVLPRQVAMFLCRELTNASFSEIGQHFGHRSHTTVLHSYSKITQLAATDVHVARALAELRQAIVEKVQNFIHTS